VDGQWAEPEDQRSRDRAWDGGGGGGERRGKGRVKRVCSRRVVKPWIFIENSNSCTIVIVPGLVAIV
jgi:hypothetical protein